MIAATTSSLAVFLPPAAAREIYGDPAVVTGGVFAPNGTRPRRRRRGHRHRALAVGERHAALPLDRRRRAVRRRHVPHLLLRRRRRHVPRHVVHVGPARLGLARLLRRRRRRPARAHVPAVRRRAPTIDVAARPLPELHAARRRRRRRRRSASAGGRSTRSPRWRRRSGRSSRRARSPSTRTRRSSWPGAEAGLRSARAFLLDEVAAAWDACVAGDPVTIEQRVRDPPRRRQRRRAGGPRRRRRLHAGRRHERVLDERPAAPAARRPRPDPAHPGRARSSTRRSAAPSSARRSTPTTSVTGPAGSPDSGLLEFVPPSGTELVSEIVATARVRRGRGRGSRCRTSKDRVAVVTGAASGIGLATAHRFADAGMQRRARRRRGRGARRRRGGDQGEGRRRARRPRPTSRPRPRSSDLADAAFNTFGNVHVLFNNAGVAATAATLRLRAWEGSLADWDWTLGVNLMGVVHGVRAFVPRMLERRRRGPHRQHGVDGRAAHRPPTRTTCPSTASSASPRASTATSARWAPAVGVGRVPRA